MKRNILKNKVRTAQTAIEYLLLMGAVVIVVLLAFRTLLPKHQLAAEGYFNVVAGGVYGPPPIYNDVIANVTYDRLRTGGYYP